MTKEKRRYKIQEADRIAVKPKSTDDYVGWPKKGMKVSLTFSRDVMKSRNDFKSNY